jgi:hypothetical protein
MDRVKRVARPMLGLVALAGATVLLLPGREAGLPRTQAGANQAAATEAGALASLCAGWGNARRDCAAFVGHFLTGVAEREPALGLAEWTVSALRGVPAQQPWAGPLEAALTTGRRAHPLPCAPEPSPDAAPDTEASPT